MKDHNIQAIIDKLKQLEDEKKTAQSIKSIAPYCTKEQIDQLIALTETLENVYYQGSSIQYIAPYCKTKEQIDQLIALTDTLEDEEETLQSIESIAEYCKTKEQIDQLIALTEKWEDEEKTLQSIQYIAPYCKTKEQIDQLIALTATFKQENYKHWSIKSIAPYCTKEQIDELIALTKTLQSEEYRQHCMATCQKLMDKLTIQDASISQVIQRILQESYFKCPKSVSTEEKFSGQIGITHDVLQQCNIQIDQKYIYTPAQEELIQNKQKVMNEIKETFQDKLKEEKKNNNVLSIV